MSDLVLSLASGSGVVLASYAWCKVRSYRYRRSLYADLRAYREAEERETANFLAQLERQCGKPEVL